MRSKEIISSFSLRFGYHSVQHRSNMMHCLREGLLRLQNGVPCVPYRIFSPHVLLEEQGLPYNGPCVNSERVKKCFVKINWILTQQFPSLRQFLHFIITFSVTIWNVSSKQTLSLIIYIKLKLKNKAFKQYSFFFISLFLIIFFFHFFLILKTKGVKLPDGRQILRQGLSQKPRLIYF